MEKWLENHKVIKFNKIHNDCRRSTLNKSVKELLVSAYPPSEIKILSLLIKIS